MTVQKKDLQKITQTLRNRAIESLNNSKFWGEVKDPERAARFQGRYQAYTDSWYLIREITNPHWKGGD